MHFKICRNSCVPNGYIKTTVCETQVSGMGSIWAANFLLALISPHFWGARFGEYLVCQLFVGPHIPLFLRCQVWGVPGLPTFRWTSCSPIFEVPGLGSTRSANFHWNPYSVWRVFGLPTFCWPSYTLIFLDVHLCFSELGHHWFREFR